jgi:tetratricopeptide (TPR) repeat protein
MKRQMLLFLLIVLFITGALLLFWPAQIRNDTPPVTPVERDRSDEPRVDATPAPVSDTPSSSDPADMSAQTSSSLTQQAKDAWNSGAIPEAMSLYQQAIKADPDNPAPYTGYGRLLTLMVSYDQALPLLERARDLQAGNAQPWLDLATLYERSQRFDESFAAQAEAAKIVGAEAITRDGQGRFVIVGDTLW